jgi:hypothetical protein
MGRGEYTPLERLRKQPNDHARFHKVGRKTYIQILVVIVPACKKLKFLHMPPKERITDIEERQQKHDSWSGKSPVEGSLELGPLPTLHDV